jgi:membrane protease YdiL (CAAX protease family)
MCAPGIFEEVIWRAILFPPDREAYAGWTHVHVLNIFTFLVYHMDYGHLHPREIFADWRFLALALVLGAACAEARMRTKSVYLGAFWHGFWVWAAAALGKLFDVCK